MRVQHALSARLGRVVLIAETTILFSTQAEVVRYRKCLAAQAADSALGVNVTTPIALVECGVAASAWFQIPNAD